MKKRDHKVCLLAAEGKKENSRAALVSETIPALFLLWGILSAFRDMMYGGLSLLGGGMTGCLTILALQASESSIKASRAVKVGIYVASLLSFLGFIPFTAQGFLDTVDRFIVLWNLRFQTEFGRFSVNSGVVLGSFIFWCLCSVLLGVFLRMLMKKRRAGMLLALVAAALLAGFVLGRSQMWLSVLCLLAGLFEVLIFTAAPGRQKGVRCVLCQLSMCLLFVGFFLATGGYGGLPQIARWRAGTVAWFEKIRYGEDTLPRGDLGRAQGLLDGEEETLELDMEKPQEWYLKGFVGGTYDGNAWRELPMDAYQGEYDGLLQWLDTKDFSALRQFASYQKLADGSGFASVGVEVVNMGAYRKYIYLPSSVESWTGGAPKERKDWQVQSGKFFGARGYGFQAVDGAPSADGIVLAPWIQDPSGEDQEAFLGAESVYRSFTKEYYMEVEEDLRLFMEELFFAGQEEMDLNDVTAQIRKVLRRETRYTEKPAAVPAGQDFVRWFLEEAKTGNAVHYASAAVMAYRTAGYAARYVEGYHYPEPEEDAKDTVVLTNKNAHAWVEIYIPGAGWLPVEVVPGMYTELYTDQIIEGAPAYQVNADPSEEGLEIEDGLAGGGEDLQDMAEQIPLSFRDILSILLICSYVCFVLYLILEIQRAARRAHKKQDPVHMDAYVRQIEKLFLVAKVKGDLAHPLELSAQVEEKITGISREEYERVIQLIQKVQFGEKKLLPHEIHTLGCFVDKVSKALFRQKGMWGKFKVRYWYALV